jgi:hypothetical protein
MKVIFTGFFGIFQRFFVGNRPKIGCLLAMKNPKISKNGELQRPIGELQTPIGELQMPIGELQTLIGELQTSIGELQTLIGELQTPIGELQTPIGELQTPIGELQTLIGELQIPIGELHFPHFARPNVQKRYKFDRNCCKIMQFGRIISILGQSKRKSGIVPNV